MRIDWNSYFVKLFKRNRIIILYFEVDNKYLKVFLRQSF